MIAIDLPAHGDSNIRLDKRYTMPEQARIVAATLDKLQLKQPVHVVGHSMGGAIAANLAAATPQHVKTLVLMNAAGVESPQPSSMARELAKGNNPLIVRNRDEYEAMLAFTMSDPPYIPGALINELTREAVARQPTGLSRWPSSMRSRAVRGARNSPPWWLRGAESGTR